MDKKPTWYDLQAMEVMDAMLKGENAKGSNYQTLDNDDIKKIHEKLENEVKPEIKKFLEDNAGPLNETEFKNAYRKIMSEVEKDYNLSMSSNKEKSPTWYDLQRQGNMQKIKKVDKGFSNKAKENLMPKAAKDWDNLKLSAEQARRAEKKLRSALEKSIKSGADKEVVGRIFDVWKTQNEKAEKFEAALYKHGKPDIMQDFAAKQRENTQKGMYMLSDRVEGVNRDFKLGNIQTKGLFTQKIAEASDEIFSAYNKAEQEISSKLRDAFGGKDLSSFNKVSPERLDGWAKAMDISDQYLSKTLGANFKLNQSRLKHINKVLDEANVQKKELLTAYKKEIDSINSKLDFESGLLKSGHASGLKKPFIGMRVNFETNRRLKAAKKDLQKKISAIDEKTLKKVNKINRSAIRLNRSSKLVKGVVKPMMLFNKTVMKTVQHTFTAPFKFANKAVNLVKNGVKGNDQKNMSIISGESQKAVAILKNTMEKQNSGQKEER